MRVKIQARNPQSGLYDDVLIDPAQRHMLALDFTPMDLAYIARRRHEQVGQARLLCGMIPLRIKTRVSGPNRRPIDVVADRTRLDWIAIELTPADMDRLLRMDPGPTTRLLTYAGPSGGKSPVVMADIEKFKAEWPDIYDTSNLHEPLSEYGGIPRAIAQNPALASAFQAWVKDWPPIFHSSHQAPEAKLILPSGITKDAPT